MKAKQKGCRICLIAENTTKLGGHKNEVRLCAFHTRAVTASSIERRAIDELTVAIRRGRLGLDVDEDGAGFLSGIEPEPPAPVPWYDDNGIAQYGPRRRYFEPSIEPAGDDSDGF
jgi:hypothetical protein